MTPSVTIRHGVPEDAAAVVVHINEVAGEGPNLVIDASEHDAVGERAFIESLDPAFYAYLVAHDHHRIVGTCFVSRGTVARLVHVASLAMAVSATHRRQGVGSRLLEAGIAWARAQGVRKMVLSVLGENQAALQLYRKFGFDEEGRRRGMFAIDGRYIDEVLMARDLVRDVDVKPREATLVTL